MKILYVTSECAPFIKAGGLGDVSSALPKALVKKGMEATVVLPYYKKIKDAYKDKLEFLTSFYVPLSWRSSYCGIFTTEVDGVRYYFVDNEYYFFRDSVYGDYDDGERYAYFCKAVLEMLGHIGFYPDVIHANDWQCSMIPLFYKAFYQQIAEYSNIKTMFTIHNIEYQGKVSYSFLSEVLGLNDYYMQFLDFGGCINLMFSAIVLSDKVTTVSKTYAEEIKNSYYGRGLDEVLNGVSYKFCGIVNGIDMDLYNPHKDTNLYHRYSVKNMAGKKIGKKKLQEQLSLAQDADCAVMSMVSRLVSHKGLDLVERVLEDIMWRRIQLVIIGTGDYHYEQMLKDKASKYQGRLSVNICFDTALASRIYAASDIFLMPSQTEPCGLSQIIAMRYGAIPVVRETGGLKDTVFPIKPQTGEGRGITFKSYNAHDMLDAIDRSLDLYYNNKVLLKHIMYHNMQEDFSWEKSASEYIAIYESM